MVYQMEHPQLKKRIINVAMTIATKLKSNVCGLNWNCI